MSVERREFLVNLIVLNAIDGIRILICHMVRVAHVKFIIFLYFRIVNTSSSFYCLLKILLCLQRCLLLFPLIKHTPEPLILDLDPPILLPYLFKHVSLSTSIIAGTETILD